MSKATEQSSQFVHLHVHTQFSMLDGATRVEQLFAECERLGQPAVAITDHGNMFGALEFCKAAVKHTDPAADFFEFSENRKPYKVKPIVGCEVYLTPDMDVRESEAGRAPKLNHLVLLAKNEEGYHNLVKLVSFSYIRGMYYKPRIDLKLLRQYSKGLICLSACLAGELPQAILAGDLKKADAIAKEYKSIFGEDYYIELQDHRIKNQKTVLPHLISIARENGIKPVCTNDVHYLHREDWAMQKVLQCIAFRRTLTVEELDRPESGFVAEGGTDDDGYFPTREFYLKSRAEMEDAFSFIEDALDNTLEIADKCDGYYFSKKQLFPSYITHEGAGGEEGTAALLRRHTFEGLSRNYKTLTGEITQRAEFELNIIGRMGFNDYFLIVWDFIRHAESEGISVGPGRGSGVGSIVAYALGITKIDPLKYGLLFERFLNPERVSSPDFDIDFCVDRRDEVIEYVFDKYGRDNVSQIITFGTLAAKAAVKDVGRVLGHPYGEVEKITKLIPFMMGKQKLSDLIGITKPVKENQDGTKTAIDATKPDLKEVYDSDEMTRRIMDMAMKIEGLPRQAGMHAAGVIICRDPIYDHIPMAKSGDGYVTTQYNMNECEQLGLLKMDFLGLRTLTDIQNALSIIEKTRGEKIDFYAMEYDDPGVFELIGEGDTHAVFQLESEGMKRFMRDLKPTVFEDIIAGVALYRPGPMDYIPAYVRGKKNPAGVTYDHPLTEPILDVTYGVMVYQEQVMQMVRALAGYTLGRADELRRMISKKKLKAMDAERKVFLNGLAAKEGGTSIPGAIAMGVDAQIANKVYDDIVKFADYAFNKSHATAYAYLAYQTAYLKRYYTVEFITAVLNNRIRSIDEITNYLSYLKAKRIGILPPDINQSRSEFSVENGAVRIGMAAIKNVGEGVVDDIVAEREKNGDFLDFEDFVARMSAANTLNKRMLESLILAGTFDCFGNARAQLMQVFEGVIARAQKDREAKLSGQFSFFDVASGFGSAQKTPYPKVSEFSLSDKLRFEKEVAGVYLTGHPLEEYADFLRGFSVNSLHFKKAGEGSGIAEEAGAMPETHDADAGGDAGAGALDPEKSAPALSDGQDVTIGGMLTEAVKRYSKAGKEYGVGKLEDLNGSIEIFISGEKLRNREVAALFNKDKLVRLEGTVRMREAFAAEKSGADGGGARGSDITLWVKKLTDARAQKSAPVKKICLYFDITDKALYSDLAEILSAYPGADEAYIRSLHDGKLYPLGAFVRIEEPMLAELTGLLGKDRIKLADC